MEFIEKLPYPKYGYEGIAQELRDHPGVWAVIAEGTVERPRKGQFTHSYLTTKGSPHMPLTEYEVTIVNHKCYARYVGNGEEGNE